MKNNLLKIFFSAWDVNFVKPFRTELVIVVKKIQKNLVMISLLVFATAYIKIVKKHIFRKRRKQ